jgi:hypothetical protein
VAQKNLIIGGCTNYGINQLKPWVLSINEVCDENTEKVMVFGVGTDETRKWLIDQGFLVVEMAQVPNIPVHVLRFLSIYHYLRDTWQDYNYVITTDVKDVYFQTDPFKFLVSRKLVIASEGLKYKDEPWGNENLFQAYGQYVHNEFKENEIFNVGTFGGESEYVKDMVFHIFTNGVNRPIPIVDQAVFNVLINTQPFKDVVTKTTQWAAELGTIMDPSKIAGFRPNLLFSEPVFENGLLKDVDGHMFPIVHQYDRVPVLKKFVQEKYGQEDESEYFTYRV